MLPEKRKAEDWGGYNMSSKYYRKLTQTWGEAHRCTQNKCGSLVLNCKHTPRHSDFAVVILPNNIHLITDLLKI